MIAPEPGFGGDCPGRTVGFMRRHSRLDDLKCDMQRFDAGLCRALPFFLGTAQENCAHQRGCIAPLRSGNLEIHDVIVRQPVVASGLVRKT